MADKQTGGRRKGLAMSCGGLLLVGLGLLSAVLVPEYWWLVLLCCMAAALYLLRHGLRSIRETGKDRTDWSEKDVMVGTVRSAEQLRHNLATCSYYAPARFVSESRLPVKYIALHEQGIGTRVGIKRYARVLTTRQVSRGSIPVTMRANTDPEELYYFFTVTQWQFLPRPIVIQGTARGKPRFTSKFLLDHCTHSYQLFAIASETEYRLMEEIQKALENAAYTSVSQVSDSHRVIISDGYITITDWEDQILDRIRLTTYARKPRISFHRITRHIRS